MTDDEICQRLADAIRYHIAEAEHRSTLRWWERLRASLAELWNWSGGPQINVKSDGSDGSSLYVNIGELFVSVPFGEMVAWVYHGMNPIVERPLNESPANRELANAVRELAGFYNVNILAARRAAAISAVQSLTR